MRALIADDEAPARAKLRRALAASTDVDIVGEAGSGREAVAMIKRFAPDIVFLDIRMPGLDGFGVVEALAADEAPYIVFVTANDEHALRAFEAGVVDYLLKPYTIERFERVLQRARERLRSREHLPVRNESASPPFLQRLMVTINGRAHFLATELVDRLVAERNYVRLFSGTAEYRIRATLGALQSRLDPVHFLRINRSTLIRLDAAKDMHEWSHGDYRVILRDGTELVWSRRYRADAQRRFGVNS